MTPRDPPELAAIRTTRLQIEAQLMAATDHDADVNACANKLDACAPKR